MKGGFCVRVSTARALCLSHCSSPLRTETLDPANARERRADKCCSGQSPPLGGTIWRYSNGLEGNWRRTTQRRPTHDADDRSTAPQSNDKAKRKGKEGEEGLAVTTKEPETLAQPNSKRPEVEPW